MVSLLTNRIKAWAKSLKRDVMTLWFVLKHPKAPWYARALAALLTAYALSGKSVSAGIVISGRNGGKITAVTPSAGSVIGYTFL